MVVYQTAKTGIGFVLVAASQAGVCAIAIDDKQQTLVDWCHSRYPHARAADDDAALTDYMNQVQRYLKSPTDRLDLPLDITGTAFQQQVWQALMTLPVGAQCSYSELAEMIGKPNAVRAVASACAANLLALAIPCHRVVKKNGALSGYRWGQKRKQWLLDRERSHIVA